jgi:hypothetical protein
MAAKERIGGDPAGLDEPSDPVSGISRNSRSLWSRLRSELPAPVELDLKPIEYNSAVPRRFLASVEHRRAASKEPAARPPALPVAA